MISLNLTLFVEVGLFLLFLWACRRWVFTPVLRVLDEREASLEAGKTEAQRDLELAEELEARCYRELAEARRQAKLATDHAMREAHEARARAVSARRHQAEEAVQAAAAEAAAAVERERAQLDALAPEMAAAIRTRLGLEVPAR